MSDKKCPCGASIPHGTYCDNCLMKMRYWKQIVAMVLGCKLSEVEEKQKKLLEDRKHGKLKSGTSNRSAD